MHPAAELVASRMIPSLSALTWSFGEPADDGGGHLFLLLNGRATLRPAGRPGFDVAAPGMLWLPALARGAVQVQAGGQGYSARIGGRFVQRIVSNPMLAVQRHPFLNETIIVRADRLAPRLASMTASFDALVEEARTLEPGSVAAASLHVGVMVLELWRGAGLPEASARSRETTVQRFTRLIEQHYREGLPISAYAGRLGVSQAHLHEACARLARRTPLALVHERLLEEACALLEQTELSVEQIGYSLGFRDPGYFNRFFRRLHGQAPGAFRREVCARKAQPPESFAAWP